MLLDGERQLRELRKQEVEPLSDLVRFKSFVTKFGGILEEGKKVEKMEVEVGRRFLWGKRRQRMEMRGMIGVRRVPRAIREIRSIRGILPIRGMCTALMDTGGRVRDIRDRMGSPTEGLGIRIIVTDDKVYLALFVAFKRLQWESGLD